MNTKTMVTMSVALISARFAASNTALGQVKDQTKWVKATGYGAGLDLKAQDEALQDAKRAAVTQACGELISSTTMVDNFELLKDQILSQSAGFIVESREPRFSKDEKNNITACEIEVAVPVGKLSAQLKPMLWNCPRIILLETEDFDMTDNKDPVLGGLCQASVERHFSGKDISLLDKSTMADITRKFKEAARVMDDTESLCALAKKFDGDLVVHVNIGIQPMEAAQLEGTPIYRYSPVLTVRTIQLDTAQIIDSQTVSSDPITSTGNAVPPDKIFKFLDKNMPAIVNAARKAIQQREIEIKPVPCTFEGCSADEFRTLKRFLVELRGVQAVLTRQCMGETIIADIQWAFDADQLAARLVDLDIPGFALTTSEQSTNSLKITVTRKI